MDTKHTPGPWSIRTISPRLFGVNDAKGIAVADIHTAQKSYTRANARLIAAAPELLGALRAYQNANRIHNDSEAELFDLAAQALTKAGIGSGLK